MSDYVRGLREKVGNDLLFMPSAHALIRDGEGRILLVRNHSGRWLLPGGGVEPGESPAQAVRRECREELTVPVEPVRLVGVYGGPEYRICYPNGDESAWVVTILECRILEGEPAPGDDEVDAVGWYQPAELDALPLSDASRVLLGEILSGAAFRYD
ncbi:MAG TPA: NUDIX domain-containing protein [Gaiellaceae bacterium]|nr:NUDIX domain-containing protein [Gaiellaceae bacterium]